MKWIFTLFLSAAFAGSFSDDLPIDHLPKNSELIFEQDFYLAANKQIHLIAEIPGKEKSCSFVLAYDDVSSLARFIKSGSVFYVESIEYNGDIKGNVNGKTLSVNCTRHPSLTIGQFSALLKSSQINLKVAAPVERLIK